MLENRIFLICRGNPLSCSAVRKNVSHDIKWRTRSSTPLCSCAVPSAPCKTDCTQYLQRKLQISPRKKPKTYGVSIGMTSAKTDLSFFSARDVYFPCVKRTLTPYQYNVTTGFGRCICSVICRLIGSCAFCEDTMTGSCGCARSSSGAPTGMPKIRFP